MTQACHAGRLRALEALEKIKDISTKVVTHTDDDIPSELMGKDMARRYFGCVSETLAKYGELQDRPGNDIALQVSERIFSYKIRDWRKRKEVLDRFRLS